MGPVGPVFHTENDLFMEKAEEGVVEAAYMERGGLEGDGPNTVKWD